MGHFSETYRTPTGLDDADRQEVEDAEERIVREDYNDDGPMTESEREFSRRLGYLC